MNTALKIKQDDIVPLFHKEPSEELKKKGARFMPLKLRALINEYGITQQLLADAMRQRKEGAPWKDGKSLSRSAVNQFIVWNVWPKKTSKKLLQRDAEWFLMTKGVPFYELKHIWYEEFNNKKRDGYSPKRSNAKNKAGRRSHIGSGKNGNQSEEPINLEFEMEILTENAIEVFKLPTDPFDRDIKGQQDIHLVKSARKVYRKVEFEALNQGLISLIGESGCGKTTSVRLLLERNKNNPLITFVHTRLKKASDISEGSLYISFIKALKGSDAKIPQAKEARAILTEELIHERNKNGGSVCLVIEEAHLLTDELLTVLKSFWEIESNFRKALGIVLLGQPPLSNKLNENMHPDAISFIRRCKKLYFLPMNPKNNEVEEYLRFKFNRIGVKLEDVMVIDGDDSAITAMYERFGPPRLTRSMLFALIIQGALINAMNEAAANGFDKVTGDIVRAV